MRRCPRLVGPHDDALYSRLHIGDGIGSRVSLGVWAMVVPPVTFIQLLPVSLAGWGVREAALVVALGSFGLAAEAALAISILVGLCLISRVCPAD